MFKFLVQHVVNHKLRSQTLVFNGKDEAEARAKAEKFCIDNKYVAFTVRNGIRMA